MEFHYGIPGIMLGTLHILLIIILPQLCMETESSFSEQEVRGKKELNNNFPKIAEPGNTGAEIQSGSISQQTSPSFNSASTFSSCNIY